MSEIRECPSCALDYEHHDDTEVCPYCGYEFPQRKSSTTWAAVLFIVLMILFALIW